MRNEPKVIERIIEKPMQPQTISAQEYLHTHQAGALVPLSQAAITGGLFSLFVLTVLLWQRVQDAWIYSLLLFTLTTAVTWVLLQGHWFSLTRLETLTGRDINGDGQIGDEKPQVINHTVKIDLRKTTESGYTQVDKLTLPMSESQLATLAAGLLAGRSLSEREWAGAGLLFSVPQFREIKTELLRRGVIRPSSPKDLRQGFVLTRAGKALMEHFANLADNPYNSPTTEIYEGEIV